MLRQTLPVVDRTKLTAIPHNEVPIPAGITAAVTQVMAEQVFGMQTLITADQFAVGVDYNFSGVTVGIFTIKDSQSSQANVAFSSAAMLNKYLTVRLDLAKQSVCVLENSDHKGWITQPWFWSRIVMSIDRSRGLFKGSDMEMEFRNFGMIEYITLKANIFFTGFQGSYCANLKKCILCIGPWWPQVICYIGWNEGWHFRKPQQHHYPCEEPVKRLSFECLSLMSNTWESFWALQPFWDVALALYSGASYKLC